jgi:hypothetical protein
MKKVYADSRIDISKGDFPVPEACKIRTGHGGTGGVSVDDMNFNPFVDTDYDTLSSQDPFKETLETGGGSSDGSGGNEQ